MVHHVKIKPVQSAVQDKAPTTSEVAQGELAVNVHASSLAIYTLDASGAVAVLADGNRQADIATTNAATAQATADLAVTAVTGTAPIVSSGGLTPALSITAATTSAAGTMSSADKVILDAVSTTYVALAGSTMTGALTLSGDPTLAMNASTKQYTDANDFWTRTGTILSPETAGDGVSIGGALVVTDDLTVNTDAMFVDASAKNVGIGNTSVAFPSGTGLQVYDASTPRIKLANSTTGVASGDGLQIYVSSSDACIDHKETGPLKFYTSGTEAMRIDSSGSLLIGGTLPSSPNITLTGSTGAASFAGGIECEGVWADEAGGNGYLNVTQNLANQPAFNVIGSTGNATCYITGGGSATFAGTITGEGVKSNTWMGADYVNMAGGNAAGGLFYGYSDAAGTTEVVRIDNDGSATFAGGHFKIEDYGLFRAYRDVDSQYAIFSWGTDTNYTGGSLYPNGDATFAGKVNIGDGSSSNQALKVYETDNEWTAKFQNDHASTPYGILISYGVTHPNTTAYDYIYCNAYLGNNQTATQFRVLSNGGIYNYQSNNADLCDEREKKNIVSLDTKWDKVKNWELKKFHYNEDADTDNLRYGVIAQQVETVCPEVLTDWEKQVAEDAVLDEDGNVVAPAKEQILRKGVKEQQMMWMAIKALQEAMAKIETLEAKVTALEAA